MMTFMDEDKFATLTMASTIVGTNVTVQVGARSCYQPTAKEDVK